MKVISHKGTTLDNSLEFEIALQDSDIYNQAIDWCVTWDWSVGNILAERLKNHALSDYERLIICTTGNEIAGCVTVEKHDFMDVDFEPFISSVYTDPKYRGQRISENLCNVAEDYVKSLGFETVYICSGEEGLYEKYGYKAFTTVDRPWGVDTIFRKALK